MSSLHEHPPASAQRAPRGPSTRPLVIAHRGASGHRPEHGLASYELAVELGADAIEPDIVATKDGVLVLRHENEISGTTDVESHAEFADRRTAKEIDGSLVEGWFTEDFTWAELATLRIRERLPALRPGSASHDGEGRILRLTDLLHLLDRDPARGRGVGLVAEIKHATHFDGLGLPLDELFARDLAEAGWRDDARLTVESFEQGVLGRIRDRGVSASYVYLIEAKGAAWDLVARHGSAAVDYATQVTPEGLAVLAAEVDGISVAKKMLIDKTGTARPALVTAAHDAGLAVFTWTLRPENKFLVKALRSPDGEKAAFGYWRAEFGRILDTGVDGVFADHPELARSVVAASDAAASDVGGRA